MALWMLERKSDKALIEGTLETSFGRCHVHMYEFFPADETKRSRSTAANGVRVNYLPVNVVKSKTKGVYRKQRSSDIGSIGVKEPKDPW